MRFLGLETSGDHSSVALVEDGHVVGESLFPSRMSLCRTLPGHIRTLLGPEGWQAVDAVGVAQGPGSFTGLRMGIAMAKAVAHATGLPLIGIPTHEALVWPLALPAGCRACVLQHARKAEVYSTTFAGAGEGAAPTVIAPCRALAIEDLLAGLRDEATEVLLLGDGIARHGDLIGEALGGLARLSPPVLWQPRAAAVAALAAARLARADPAEAMALRPLYLLGSQAERVHGVDLGMN